MHTHMHPPIHPHPTQPGDAVLFMDWYPKSSGLEGESQASERRARGGAGGVGEEDQPACCLPAAHAHVHKGAALTRTSPCTLLTLTSTSRSHAHTHAHTR